ncbi:MAG: immune inhibitor A [Actinomycetota bacterium]|nr:immune inhibitor A [Actinomycetota bacterium]
MRRHLVGLIALALFLACVSTAASRSTSPTPQRAGLSALEQALLAHTELTPVVRGRRIMAGENFRAARSFSQVASPTPGVTQNGVCNDQKAEANVGDTRILWVHNFKLGMDIQKSFVLAAKTPHVYMWVDTTQDGTLVSRAQALAGAQAFESIYDVDRAYFGEPARCDQAPFRQPPRLEGIWGGTWYDADDDPHINIVNFDPDVGATVVAGYYSPGDEYPRTVNEHSNEGEFFYMNSLLFAPGSTTYNSILAHEFYHMIQFANDANEDTWVNEGMADVAIEVNGLGGTTGSHTSDYANHPEDQLTNWDGQLYDYGNAYSFFSYFLEHYGPSDDPTTPFKENYALARQITQFERDGLAGVDDILAANPYKAGLAASYQDNTAHDVYLDRAVANVVNDRSLADGQYGYGQLAGFKVNPHGGFGSYPASEDGNATAVDPALGRVFGDRVYFFDSAGDGTFDLRAQSLVPIVDNEAGMPSPTHELWGNRVDESLTFAERTADLTGATAPRLRFGYWFDIEEDYDYAYLRVSDDGGATWDNLVCCGSRTTNPNGNNRGNGITGRSGAVLPTDGPRWQTADVDLSAYAGKVVTVRFEYVTDPAVLRPGFTVDNVSLVDGATQIWPTATFESGLDGFTVGGSGAPTFLRITPKQPNQVMLQLVKVGRGIDVQRVAATPDGSSVRASGAMNAFRTYAIFTSLTPITSEHYGYQWQANATSFAQPAAPALTAQGGSRIQLSWTPGGSSGSLAPQRYVVEESTAFAEHLKDDAESGFSRWTRNVVAGATPWSQSSAKTHSGNFSFFTQGVEHSRASSLLTLNAPVAVPSSGQTLLTFWDWAINEPDDETRVEVSDDGTNWAVVYRAGRAALPDEATVSLAAEPMTQRVVDLSAYRGKTIRLRFNYATGPSNFFAYTPYGWYVDDIAIVTSNWTQIAETTGTTLSIAKASPGTFFYRVAALYSQVAQGPYSNVASAEARPQADLVVTNVEFGNGPKVRGADQVTITATVGNVGSVAASNVGVRFAVDGRQVGADQAIASIPAGGTGKASAVWSLKDVPNGEHTITVTADPAGQIAEDSETNNTGTAKATVQGNKLKNGSFESSSSGSSPDGWTGAGTTSYSSGGSDGSRSVTAGPGGSWTSDPVVVQAGEKLDLVVTSSGAAGTAVVQQLSATGAVLSSLTTPLEATSAGTWRTVEQSITVPAGVTQLRVVLLGAALGTTRFDAVGLWSA